MTERESDELSVDDDRENDRHITKREVVDVVSELLSEAGRRWNEAFGIIQYRLTTVERFILTTQEDINAVATQVNDIDARVGDLKTTLTADNSAIQQEINALQASGVDVTALKSAVDKAGSDVNALGDVVTATTALVPATPTPGGTPTPPATGGVDTPSPTDNSGDPAPSDGSVPPATPATPGQSV